MKSIICALLVTSFSFSQNETEKEIYERASSYIVALNSNEKSDLPTDLDRERTKDIQSLEKYCTEKAYSLFKELVENYSNSVDSPIYFYHFANLSNDRDEIKIYYKKVIEANTNWRYYQIESKKILAFIAFEEKQPELGCKYLKELENGPKRNFTCGTEREIYETQLALLNEKCKSSLKEK